MTRSELWAIHKVNAPLTEEQVIKGFKKITEKSETDYFHEYQRPSKERRFPVQVGDLTFYMNPDLINLGNDKLVGSVGITQLLPGVTCEQECEGCYAIALIVAFPRLYAKLLLNTWLAESNLEKYIELLTYSIHIHKWEIKKVRFNEDGDMPSREYIEAINKVAEKFPEIPFSAISKSSILKEMKDNGELAPNFNVMYSRVLDGEGEVVCGDDGKPLLNYGDEEYIKELHDKYGVFICPCGGPNEPEYKICGGACEHCWLSDSTLYRAHKKGKARRKNENL